MSKHILTGAFGYTGSYLAQLLLAQGAEVHSLTSSAERRNNSVTSIKTHPFDFQNPDKMAKAMEGAEVFYNTYWVRFNHKNFSHHEAVANTKALFQAAKMAGVGRVIHISITNPSLNSPFEYFKGKAELEETLKNSGLPYTILRPAVLFGGRDILINNICWALRTFPILGLFGRGRYGIRPIFVEDLANLMLKAGQTNQNQTINAVGPERFTYASLVKALARIMGLKRLISPCPPALAYAVGKLVGLWQRDIFITWPEVGGLMSGLLDTEESFDEAPARTLLTAWAQEHKSDLGCHYASELARR